MNFGLEILYDFINPQMLLHGSWLAFLFIGLSASYHILSSKKDSVAATGWLGVVWLSPYLGTILYAIFGINRIRRKGVAIRDAKMRSDYQARLETGTPSSSLKALATQMPEAVPLTGCIGNIVGRPLAQIDSVELLRGGESAYPKMLAAISEAKESVYLATYIFDQGNWGKKFLEALVAAQERGVRVRILVDAIGSRYSFPSVIGSMRKKGLKVKKFLPNVYPWQFAFLNLRNHRKILVVDTNTGFTGGINIRDNHVAETAGKKYTDDLHFQFTGPVVGQFLEVFAEDWEFSAKEQLPLPELVEPVEPPKSWGRVVTDGPDVDFEKILWSLYGAIAVARDRIWITTPYFLPNQSLVDALGVAKLRGVDVRLLLPRRSNIWLLNWAVNPLIDELESKGIVVRLQERPFDHSKFMLVDNYWSFVGSSNWDSRSLRLNFEANVELYDRKINELLADQFQQRLERSKLPAPRKKGLWYPFMVVRNNASRLLAPYL